jgi:hypothetical protein
MSYEIPHTHRHGKHIKIKLIYMNEYKQHSGSKGFLWSSNCPLQTADTAEYVKSSVINYSEGKLLYKSDIHI